MPAWPGTLPQYVLEAGYKEQLPNVKLETEMEAGQPKARRRFTTAWRKFQVQLACTAAQVTAFETFYNTSCLGGTLTFTWVHPRTQAAATFRFAGSPPAYSQRGETTIIGFALEQVA